MRASDLSLVYRLLAVWPVSSTRISISSSLIILAAWPPPTLKTLTHLSTYSPSRPIDATVFCEFVRQNRAGT